MINVLSRILLGSATLIMGVSAAHAAEDDPYAKSMKIELPQNTRPIYLGGGLTKELMHGTAVKPTEYGNFYAKVGQFYDGDGVAAQAGYRYPVALSGKDNNGVYLGGFAGHVEAEKDEGKLKNRLGGGLDVSYLWFDASRISSLSVGVYMGETFKDDLGVDRTEKVQAMFSLNLSGGFF